MLNNKLISFSGDLIVRNGRYLGKGGFGDVSLVKINDIEYAQKIMKYDLNKMEDILEISNNLRELIVMLHINNIPTDSLAKLKAVSYNF